ncbi:unnamed protein product [Prunus armeniaca]
MLQATDKCASFFKALKGNKQHITWTTECDLVFQEPKDYMSKAPLLSKPLPRKVLFLYLSVLHTVKPETFGRLVKWAIELREFDVQFKPRPGEKGQAVANFISELTASVAPIGSDATKCQLDKSYRTGDASILQSQSGSNMSTGWPINKDAVPVLS